ncbi:hypothetical protein [Ferrimonas balearica]|uniref:hypothetical protein n=1 Tax=Ferrimonas balearica TaxID=44012 RepID=UPI001C9920A1|nr:hypothetical protein [Ferrimonas balearica]MBY5991603.1 hypothetical protein [Ferrimonas balearica]
MGTATNKTVINGVYETNKMRVRLSEDRVTKHFKPTTNATLRYRRDREGLRLLSNEDRFPTLLSHDDKSQTLTMTRLPGQAVNQLFARELPQLRALVDTILDSGVARHAMPLRDILRDENGTLRMVDFERTTLRQDVWAPAWWIAKRVTQYHLYRTINQVDGTQLSEKEQRFLRRASMLRRGLQPLRPIKESLKQRRLSRALARAA